jgi:hypothetical protein
MSYYVILECDDNVSFIKSFSGSLEDCNDHKTALVNWNSSMAKHLDQNGHADCKPEDDCHCFWRKMNPNIKVLNEAEFRERVELFNNSK